MNALYYAASAILIVILIYLVFLQRGKQTPPVTAKPSDKAKKDTANPYMGLRAQIFALKPADLGISLPADKETAFGVVVEFGTEDGEATIISLATGDASMYTSGGGGMIGGAAHPNVKKAAVDFVNAAQHFLGKMQPVDTTLPAVDHIKFHILTNKATYSYDGPEEEITNPNSEWAELFNNANEVITQLRLISDK